MKKYKEFVKARNLSEGFISKTVKGIGSFLRGDKEAISGFLDNILTIEKEYIDKTDELGHDIFLADNKKSTDPVEATELRQKAVMSKRAIDAMTVSKNSEVSSIMSKIGKICRKNPDLLGFYKGERSMIDAKIAKYAYDKAKKFRDQKYEDDFYNIWKKAEDTSTKFRRPYGEYTSSDEPSKDFEGDDEYDIEVYTDLGSFGLSVSEFNDLINTLSKRDLESMLRDASDLKYYLDLDFDKKKSTINWKRMSYRSSEYLDSRISKERYDKLKQAHRVAIDKILNKMSILKSKLRIKES